MEIKIWPRMPGERGGYLSMPLKRNVPIPKDESWTLTTCPHCGAECWDRPLPKEFNLQMFDGKLCTLCAIKAGMG